MSDKVQAWQKSILLQQFLPALLRTLLYDSHSICSTANTAAGIVFGRSWAPNKTDHLMTCMHELYSLVTDALIDKVRHPVTLVQRVG